MQLLKTCNLNPYFFPLNIPPSHHSLASLSTNHFNKQVHNPYSESGNLSLIKRLSTSWSCSKRYGDLAMIRCGAIEHDDAFYVRRCVEIARTAVGYTSPNPMVGCVIVKYGKIVGEGFHPKPGQPHAEVFALRAAGDLAENATAYVSLEPCNHYGRTPPCTEALIKAKVKKVVIGMVDPNPIVASKGVERLQAAGIEVVVGVEEELCKNLLEAYAHTMLAGKPFVTLRYSISINGHFSNKLGDGASEIGGYYSKLLQEYDAVLVSSTSLTENSLLPSSQEPGANQPLCIVIGRDSISVPKLSNFTFEPSKCIIFAQDDKVVAPEIALKGIETVLVERMNMDAILSYCKSRGFCNVLLDLRGSLDDFRELLEESSSLTQKVIVEALPFWSENSHGNAGIPLETAKGLKVKNLLPKVCGQSILLEGYF